MAENENRQRALEDALKKIEKSYGKGAVMKLGEKVDTQIQTVSSGSLALDIALGVGGFPRGRIIEVYGPESSGKTTVALHAVAEVQKRGGVAAFIDAEHALDPEYAKALGVNIDELLLSQPDTGEQGLGIADALVSSGAVDIVIVDSVAALVPRAEIDGDMGQSHVGLQARLMSQALRKLTANIKTTNCLVIFINQIRMKIGVMFGNPETTTGGNALKFYSSVRLDIRRSGVVKDGDNIIGSETKVKVVKNKVAPPFREVNFDIMYGEGIARTNELLILAEKQGFINKSGAWFSYEGEKIGQGKNNAIKWLAEHPEVAAKIEADLRELFMKNPNTALAPSPKKGKKGKGADDVEEVDTDIEELEEDIEEIEEEL